MRGIDLIVMALIALALLGWVWWHSRPPKHERGIYRVFDCHCGRDPKCKLCRGAGEYRRRIA